MFSEDELRIISEIKNYAGNYQSYWKDWYIGIASDPEQRLFTDHSVNQKTDIWIYRICQNADSARKIEEYLINSLKTKGDTGGGDNTTKFVYAYLTTSHSKE
ncbi:MAG: hypothetical protein WC895_00785 [Candidatus Shapirobacteria bacterium]|jgi:hypothetical protein